MYKEKLSDNLYGVDIFSCKNNYLNEIEHGAVIHVICHHITDENIIKEFVDSLIKSKCKVFHLFGQQHSLWKGILNSQIDSEVVVIDYFSELEEFEMDLVTHLIEKSELQQCNINIDEHHRMDYVIYDDIVFFWGIKDDIKKYKELEDVK